ncbi:hypothetical protein GCM10022254_55850 [Actinomadura meridiana]|uniref:Uncharacterized protein n=1 Tax=Actinomadura meridiana TaxID=559626 RepID=A0ABP8CFZ4_9ACTN
MIHVTLDTDADPIPLLMLQAETWEVHIRAPLADLSRLSKIRTATWDDRRSIQAGTCGLSPVFWSITKDAQATILIGQDDETWHTAFLIPLTAIDQIVTLTH